MSVNPLGSSSAANSAAVAAANAVKNSRIAAATQEATESVTTTRKEAQSGDPVAQRKLQAIQQKSTAAEVPPAAKGSAVDVNA